MDTTTASTSSTRGSSSTRGRTARRRALILTVAVTLVMGFGIGATKADAASYGHAYSAGGSQVSPATGQYIVKAQNGYLSRIPGLRVPGPRVTPSRASNGWQWVRFKVTVSQWYAGRQSWVQVSDTNPQFNWGSWLAPGGSMYLPTNDIQLGNGYFKVEIAIAWNDANGRFLGTTYWNYNHASDYRCLTNTPCRVWPGYVQL